MQARELALAALLEADPQRKAELSLALRAGLAGGARVLDPDRVLPVPPQPLPGRPARPQLLQPQQMPKRRTGSALGRAALLHAIAHIEFNAINLALDIVWRFAGLPDAFYRDWIRVAAEEAEHFGLLRAHLQTLGHDYGDFPAHDGLWSMAAATSADLLARLALVPRTLEARGLDANPAIRDRLAASGDLAGAAILDRILADEIGHVQLGNHWYRWVCARDDQDPVGAYAELAARYRAPRLKGPFNLPARLAAGFTQVELDWLQALAAETA